MKITTRCGAEAVDQLNAILIRRAVDDPDGGVEVGQVRGDTTVAETDVA